MLRRFPYRTSPAAVTRAACIAAMALSILFGTTLPAIAETGRVTGLQLPRFVSLRPNEVNLRAGPGLRYPIQWVYQRANMPVEVIGEFETWRQIRDWQGTTGWVHEVMIQAQRTARITGNEPRLLRREPETGANPVAMLEPGVIGKLEICRNSWCQIRVEGHSGWLPRSHFYGIYAGETLE